MPAVPGFVRRPGQVVRGLVDGIRRRRWDLTALLNAADPRAPLPERHLWLVRLAEWLRHAAAPRAEEGEAPAPAAERSPLELRRLRHLLNVLERNPEHRERVVGLLRAFRSEIDVAALFADLGFTQRMAMLAEARERAQAMLLPATPATTDLAELFGLLFPHASDALWISAIDDASLARVAALFDEARPENESPLGWREPFLEALLTLAAQVAAAGASGEMRQRMSPELLVGKPFRQLLRSAESLFDAAEAGDAEAMLLQANLLRGLLAATRTATTSILAHLEEHGVSVELVFQIEQLLGRAQRIEDLLACVLVPAPGMAAAPERGGVRREVVHLVATLVRVVAERRSLRALFARQYSMLARKVVERSAETGEHYITRTRREWWAMLRKALGGGAVVAATVFAKFAIAALALSAFWGGFWAGANYAVSFVAIHLLHWTLATKQPAMTASAMATKLDDVSHDAGIENFVDEVAHLIRSQTAGIVGNLVMVAPVVLVVQVIVWQAAGRPLVGASSAEHVLQDLSLLGPTPLYAAFTGVLLFASSLVAGWAENWFVLHKLDSALRWHPRILALLGARRAEYWSRWWRANVSGLAANISLGLPVLREPALWWCVASIPVIGAVNLGVSFFLAFKLALRARGVRVADRSRVYRALRRRLRVRFFSFLLPPRAAVTA
ncbi:MAG: recombinase [Burkholderiaceae bacterium]